MTDSLSELRLDEFLARLSSPAPTPGGGSASALAGATSAALLHMVLELTRPGPEGPDEAELAELTTAAAGWQSELLRLVELDAAAYDSVVAARRLPKGTDREREARSVQVAAAVREATRVPLDIVRRAGEVLELARRVVRIGNRNALSDVGVAALLAGVAARGGGMNVRINLPALPDDDPLRREAAADLERLLTDAESAEREVHAAVEERLT